VEGVGEKRERIMAVTEAKIGNLQIAIATGIIEWSLEFARIV
jgi:hypothetical protein